MSLRRHRLLLLIAVIAFASIALSMIPASSALSASSSAQQQSFTIIVGRNGFNGTAGTFSITVQQGDSVKITFVYGDSDLSVDNPHAIAIDGYGIHTVDIGKTNPTATVEFVAGVSGTFKFYCYIPCLGMENLQGTLVVTPTEGPRTATTLGLATASPNPKSGSVMVSATVQDENGKPLPGVPVKFYENTTFGKLLLNTVPTDFQGVATLNYTSSRVGAVQIIAEYPGDLSYSENSNTVIITVPSSPTESQPEGTVYLGVTEPNHMSHRYYGIPFPPNLSMIAVPRIMNIFAVVLAAIVVLGVWSTYGYIGRQIASLPERAPPRQQDPGPPLPIKELPLDIGGVAPVEVAGLKDRALALLLLLPLLGVIDALLVNSLGLPILWRSLSLVGLAIVETSATVAVLTGRNPAD